MRLTLICLLVFLTIPNDVLAQNKGQDVVYTHGSTQLQGYWSPAQCQHKTKNNVTPTIIIVHQWKGLTNYEKRRADMFAAQCYNAFALDMYGQGIRPTTNKEARAESNKYKNDPAFSVQRMQAALNYIQQKPGVSLSRVSAIGYCFGGGMVLNLARSGANISSVVSFHGNLKSPMSGNPNNHFRAKVYAHHGAADPFVPPEDVTAFKQEMKAHSAQWKFSAYKGAVHAFTQPTAGNNPSTGAAYNAAADRASWQKTMQFFEQTL